MKHIAIAIALVACSNKTNKESAGSNGATPTCVPGDTAACAQAGYKWTGSACCFDLPPNTKVQCIAGELSACAQAGGKWTGKLCCLEGAMTCTDGELAACAQSGSLWTGAKCCVKS
jgi:hypothetical protein